MTEVATGLDGAATATRLNELARSIQATAQEQARIQAARRVDEGIRVDQKESREQARVHLPCITGRGTLTE